MPRTVVVRAPTRIDLGGGWTDVPPYCDREGGFVCNVAIDRYATATVAETEHENENEAGDGQLVRAVAKRSGLGTGQVGLRNDFPVGAGLGGSSSASAAMLVAAAEWRGDKWDRAEVAETGRRIEVEDLGIAGGRQDHYAATFGGALALTFTTAVSVRRIEMSAAARDALAARSTLIYTGQSRVSGETITAVLGAYEQREPRVLTALRRMRELAEQMTASLERADFETLGEQLNEHWTFQRDLHPSIPTAKIDEIIARATSAGAIGAKAMGASGGGCVLVLSRVEDRDAVRSAVAHLGSFVDFGVDTAGVCVVGRPS